MTLPAATPKAAAPTVARRTRPELVADLAVAVTGVIAVLWARGYLTAKLYRDSPAAAFALLRRAELVAAENDATVAADPGAEDCGCS